MAQGYIYVLTNRSMPGIVKIGRTEREPADRARELRTTGVPTPFDLVHARLVEDCDSLEKQVHRVLAERGVRTLSDREFFEISPDEAIDIIDLLTATSTTPQIDFSRQWDLWALAESVKMPLGIESISEEYASQIADRLSQIGRQGCPRALRQLALVFVVNFPSALKFRTFWQEYLELARREANWHSVTESNGRDIRNAVGRDAAEYLWRLHSHRWLLPLDFAYVSSFLASGERFAYEGYITEIKRSDFPADIRKQAEDV